ncbi:MAG: electron transport complex subunit RsxC [Oscillospiraceae bacterium]
MSKLHSIKLPHYSESAEQLTRKLPVPEEVTISMAQHIGAPCDPLVAVGDRVLVGQKIGDTGAFMSAPVHASVSGEVTEIKDVMNVSGRLCKTVTIKSDNRMEVSPEVKPPKIESREDFLKAVRESGSIGLGGAGFPTHVKLAYDLSKVNIEYLLINGAECEPYITSDYRELMENTDAVIGGIKLILKWLEIPKAIVGIEADKPEAISKLTKLTAAIPEIEVKKLRSNYPQGAEKVLVHSLTGRIVGEGKLPSDVGCVVMNVSTAGFLHNYVRTGMPLVKRRITVDGNIVNSPCNFFVPVGTLLHSVVGFASLRKQPDKIILGGPMMGNCAFDPDTPLGKTNNAVLLFNEAPKYVESPCIRCGRCIRACSLNLMPTELEHAYDSRDPELLKKLKVNLCMNCGACSFVCPARRNLAEKNQLAKDFLRQYEAAQKEKGK